MNRTRNSRRGRKTHRTFCHGINRCLQNRNSIIDAEIFRNGILIANRFAEKHIDMRQILTHIDIRNGRSGFAALRVDFRRNCSKPFGRHFYITTKIRMHSVGDQVLRANHATRQSTVSHVQK